MKSIICQHDVKQVTCKRCPDFIPLAGGMYYSLSWDTRKQMHYYDDGKEHGFHGYVPVKGKECIWQACRRAQAKAGVAVTA